MEAIYVLLGWLLGIFSPLLSDYVVAWRRRRIFLNSCKAELIDLQFILANVSYLLISNYGRLTTEYVRDIARLMETYDGYEISDRFTNSIRQLSEFSQEQLDQFAALKNANVHTGSSLKSFKPNFILANISEIQFIDKKTQVLIYELIRRLDTISQEVAKTDAKMVLTFDSSISDANHKRLIEDIRRNYLFIADQSRLAALKIEHIRTNML
jgi:hypothetical protein